MKRSILALIVIVGLFASVCTAYAETTPAQTFTAPGIDAFPMVTRDMNICTLQVAGSGSFTIVPQGSNDAGLTYATVPTIGNGSITAPGTYTGPIAGYAGSYFRFSVTAVSGTVSIVKTCTPQISGGGGGTYTAPPVQNVAPAPSSSPFTVNCVSGCSSSSIPTPYPTNADGGVPSHVTNFPVLQNVALPSIAQSPVTLSTVCTTPTTPSTCGSTSYAIFPLGVGVADYSYQVNAINGATLSFYTSDDGVNFFATNLTVSGGSPSALTVANSTSAAGKFSGIGGSNAYAAIVMTTVGTSAVTVIPYLSPHDAAVSVHAAVPLTIASLPPVSVSNFPATQPVSIATTVPVSVATTLNVNVTNPANPYTLVAPYPSASPFPVTVSTTVPVSVATTLPVSIASTVPISAATTIPVSIATTQPVSIASTVPVSIASTVPVSIASSVPVVQTPVTGNGFTHYPATSITAATATTICSVACTGAALYVSWSVPSNTTCYLTTYNSTSPTVGTNFVGIYPISTSAPGSFAVPWPPTIGGKFTTALSYAITTTPTGNTACNTTASELWVEAWYV